MFSYRGLFLAATISLANIILADVLVQPGYEHHSGSNLPLHQSVPQHQIQFPTQQYRMEQIPNQVSVQYLSGVQSVYPNDELYQDNARSHLVRYPYHSPYHHYLPRPHHVHYAKIGGHGYKRPSVFVGYPQPETVHDRYERSRRSIPESSTESTNKSEIVTHDNDVAAKSSLTDTKHPTAIDSLLPEHEPTDTNNKRVENRQIKNDQIMGPHLFGLYPEQMYSGQMYSGRQANPFQMLKKFYQTIQTNLFPPKTEQDEVDCANKNTYIISDGASVGEPIWDERDDDRDSELSHEEFDAKYRDASANPDDSYNIFTKKKDDDMYIPDELDDDSYDLFTKTYTPEYEIYTQDDSYDLSNKRKYYTPAILMDKREQVAHEQPRKKNLYSLQGIKNMNTATPRQDIHLILGSLKPSFFFKKSPETNHLNNAAVTTFARPQQSSVSYMQNPIYAYRNTNNNKELSETKKIVSTANFDRSLPNYYSYYSNSYPRHYLNYNLDKYSNNANLYTDLNKKNFNLVDNTETSNQNP